MISDIKYIIVKPFPLVVLALLDTMTTTLDTVATEELLRDLVA